MFISLVYFVALSFLTVVHCLCGANIRWSHHFNMEDVYGMWYGVGYAQHSPDLTDQPNKIGCVALYITDATGEGNDDWLKWSLNRRNYTNEKWRSNRNNPFSDTPLSGSWLDVRIKRRAKRGVYDDIPLRVLWDEDGQTMEQSYVYSLEAPGLWTVKHWRPLEKEMLARGIDVWYPDDPPRHSEAIRVLKASPQMLVINHCSETGSGVFTLILRRTLSRMDRWEWLELQKDFYIFDLPHAYRYVSVCKGCIQLGSVAYLILAVFVLRFF